MKYAPSALIGRLSRSAGSTTAAHNRYGAYLRNRVIPTNPATSAQTAVRSALATISAAWRSLTSAQRAEWEAIAPSLVRTDSLGENYTLNGFAAYMSCWRNLVSVGSSGIASPVAYVPPASIATATITSEDTPTLSIAYTVTPLATGVKLMVFATRGVSPGKNFLPNGEYKLIFVSAAAAASPANVLSAYQAVFGTPVVGEKIFFKLKVVDTASGYTNAVLEKSVITVEA